MPLSSIKQSASRRRAPFGAAPVFPVLGAIVRRTGLQFKAPRPSTHRQVLRRWRFWIAHRHFQLGRFVPHWIEHRQQIGALLSRSAIRTSARTGRFTLWNATVVVTMWDWAGPKVYLHDEISTDRRHWRCSGI